MHISSATTRVRRDELSVLEEGIASELIVGALNLDHTFSQVDVFLKPMFDSEDVGGKVNVHSLLSICNQVHGSKLSV